MGLGVILRDTVIAKVLGIAEGVKAKAMRASYGLDSIYHAKPKPSDKAHSTGGEPRSLH